MDKRLAGICLVRDAGVFLRSKVEADFEPIQPFGRTHLAEMAYEMRAMPLARFRDSRLNADVTRLQGRACRKIGWLRSEALARQTVDARQIADAH